MTRRERVGEKRLGKGLGALLGDYLNDSAAGTAADDTVGGAAEGKGSRPSARSIPIADIVPNQYQPRREFAEEELADLAASLEQNGLLQPIVVRPAGVDDASWELVAGERRWRAATRLGWTHIPATVREVDDRTMLVLALVENIQRSQLNALEEADAYQRLGAEFSLSQQEIADVVGRDRSTVANAIRLLQLPASVRTMVAEGTLSAGHARALLGLENPRQQADLARRAVEGSWSVREIEAEVQRARGSRKRQRPGKPRDATERQLEEELQRALGTEARIHRGRGMKGRIEIPFYGAEDFERLFEILAGRSALDVVS